MQKCREFKVQKAHDLFAGSCKILICDFGVTKKI